METVVKIFKALSDETRLKILMIISSKVMCQRGISKCLQISDSAVSQHIKILKDADIIIRYKEGYYVFYKINKDIFNECIEFMRFLETKDHTFIDINNTEKNEQCCKVTCKGKKRCCKKGEEM